MEFIEIVNMKDVDLLLTIVETYPHTNDELSAAKEQLHGELGESGGNRYIYIGFDNDMAVAMVQLVVNNADNDPELADGKNVAHIHNLRVRRELQGKGIGRQMMAFIEDKARRMGKLALTLGVDDYNERALLLYRELGYKVFKTEGGRVPHETCLFMKKSI